MLVTHYVVSVGSNSHARRQHWLSASGCRENVPTTQHVAEPAQHLHSAPGWAQSKVVQVRFASFLDTTRNAFKLQCVTHIYHCITSGKRSSLDLRDEMLQYVKFTDCLVMRNVL